MRWSVEAHRAKLEHVASGSNLNADGEYPFGGKADQSRTSQAGR